MNIRNFLKVTACSLILVQGSVFSASMVQAASKQKKKSQSDAFSEVTIKDWWQKGEEQPVIHMVVDKVMQRVSVYSNGELVSRSKVSTGKTGHETPGGIFSILTKNRHHYSNIYSRAPMPYMQRLTWSGIALHESKSVPDYPASHGCVRLPGAFASKLFKYTKKGAQVIITNRDIRPRKISSDQLFDLAAAQEQKQLLRLSKEPDSIDQSSPVKSSDAPLRILITRHSGKQMVREIQDILNELKYEAGDVDGWMGPQTGKAIAAFQKDYRHEVTGALGPDLLAQLYRATGRGKTRNAHIYVRQKYLDLFDAPLKLEDEKRPLGTHQFTAVFPQPETKQVAELKTENSAIGTRINQDPYWLGLTIEQTDWKGRPFEKKKRKKAKDTDNEVVVEIQPSSAEEALARIELPEKLKNRIAALITPGSTLVIADEGFSNETGKGTDFIVLTK